jgi:hypothetical protein
MLLDPASKASGADGMAGRSGEPSYLLVTNSTAIRSNGSPVAASWQLAATGEPLAAQLSVKKGSASASVPLSGPYWAAKVAQARLACSRYHF